MMPPGRDRDATPTVGRAGDKGMQTETRTNHDLAELKLAGSFDFKAYREFQGAYKPLLEQPGVKRLEVDMGGLTYMDSSALGMLLLLREKADVPGIRVSLINCRDIVRDILEVANFARFFEIH